MTSEISLNELEEWYLKSLENRFKRQHKLLSKIFTTSEKEIAEARISLKTWTERSSKNEEEPLDPKNQKIMERFIDNVVNALEEIKIPSIHVNISYENSITYTEGIKKVYLIYNEQGRKSLPRFGKAYRLEIKEIDMHLRNLGNMSAKVNKFLLKNYKEGKLAEQLLKKIPLLSNNIERLGNYKTKIDAANNTQKEMKDNMKNMEEKLYELSQDPEIQEYEKIERIEDKISTQLSDSLKFKKAFKKMIKAIEKKTINARDIRPERMKAYIKNPISTIIKEGPKIHQLRQILIKTRMLLEDEKEPLKMKADLRNRIITNINQIVSNNSLEPTILELIKIKEQKEEVKKKIDKKGIATQRAELKDKIATSTVELEHFENDLNRRNREFKDLLEKVKNDRIELKNSVLEETGEDIKIKVVIPM